MKLKDAPIDLTGLFRSTIENNIILCSGLSIKVPFPGVDYDKTEVYEWTAISPKSKGQLVKEVVLVAFYDNEENGLMFNYKQSVFIVDSVTFEKISFHDMSGAKYSVERINVVV